MARRHVRFLPEGSIAGGALPWVTGVMVFLSALAAGFGFALHGAVGDWASDLSRRISVQIVAAEQGERERQSEAALRLLKAMPGIGAAERVSQEETARLLEPWLGTGGVSDDLPVPVMLDLTRADNAAIDIRALTAALRTVAPDARVDDHQDWLNRLERLSRAMQIIAGMVVGLVLAATAAIAVFGTRAGLASQQASISIMHHMGATDQLIAAEFRRRFLMQGLKGGVGGLLMAAAIMGSTGALAARLGGGLVPKMALSPLGWAVLLALPLFAAFLTMMAAHVTVRRDLARMP